MYALAWDTQFEPEVQKGLKPALSVKISEISEGYTALSGIVRKLEEARRKSKVDDWK